MQITTDTDLSRFVGGQIEVQNPGEGYLYRGEIKAITVKDDETSASLVVELNWLAKSERPGHWVKSDNKPYEANLRAYSASDIGDGRICLNSSIIGEMAILFPQGGSTLDRAKVEGL